LSINSGIEYGVVRGVAFAPYADMIWMETKKPVLSEAKEVGYLSGSLIRINDLRVDFFF